jgi:hypothetical protein
LGGSFDGGHYLMAERSRISSQRERAGCALSLNDALSTLSSSVAACLAAAVVDIRTGSVLGIHSQDTSGLDLAAAAAGEFFAGPSVLAIEETFRRFGDINGGDPQRFEEVIVLGDGFLHFFQRSRTQAAVALVVVCRSDAPLEQVLSRARLELEGIEREMP